MDYLFCNVERMLSPEYRKLPREVRFNHFVLLCACAEVEARLFQGARLWSTGLIQKVFGLSHGELVELAQCHLVEWEGDDLVVPDYDPEEQRRLNDERTGGTP